MSSRGNDRVALVTGSARSIGAAVVSQLARDGFDVAVHYHSRPEQADDLVRVLTGEGANAAAFGGDLTAAGAAARLLDDVAGRFGGLDVVVANAGVPNPGVDIAHGSDQQFAELVAVNTQAVYSVLREAAARLRPDGRLINIGSSSTLFPTPDRALYSASKAASLVLTRAFAQMLAERGITANSIVVGPVDDGFLAGRPQQQTADLAAASPSGRLGTADDIAGVVSFLASDAARWITGQELLVNGGALA